MKTDAVIANLIYCINIMARDPINVRSGIGFIANMKGWQMSNFAVDYCRRFMKVLQGNVVPVKVTSFLIVNPPKWFGTIWKFMKTVLSKEFQAKVAMIEEKDLPLYLEKGFEKHLPDEFSCGKAPTKIIVKSFVKQQQLLKVGTGGDAKLPRVRRSQRNGS